MIIRVQTNVGIWRISNVNPSSTISDITEEIAITRPRIFYTQPLSLDAGGKQTIGNSNTLDELGLKNGDMIYCRVSTNNDNTGTSSESRKRKHNAQHKNSSSTSSDRSRGLPMGTFQGLKIYRNSFTSQNPSIKIMLQLKISYLMIVVEHWSVHSIGLMTKVLLRMYLMLIT